MCLKRIATIYQSYPCQKEIYIVFNNWYDCIRSVITWTNRSSKPFFEILTLTDLVFILSMFLLSFCVWRHGPFRLKRVVNLYYQSLSFLCICLCCLYSWRDWFTFYLQHIAQVTEEVKGQVKTRLEVTSSEWNITLDPLVSKDWNHKKLTHLNRIFMDCHNQINKSRHSINYT